MQLLVAAVRADDGTTSEGACTARVVRLLVARGHDVRLLVAAAGPQGSGAAAARAAVGPGVEVAELDPAASRTGRLGHRAAAAGLRYRPDVAVQLTTGFGLEDLAAVAAWRVAIARHEHDLRPDVTVTRGAGLDLHPVLARAAAGGPWLAHLHDPWPASWYPPSYAARARLVSARQEQAARRVLRDAPVLTAPTERLVAWMADRSGVAVHDRAHVVPHLADGHAPLDPAGRALLAERPFGVCHAGTLLGARAPGGLLEGFRAFLAAEPAAAADAGLTLVGPWDRRHRDDARLHDLVGEGTAAGWLALHDRRVPGPVARAAVDAAAVGVVLEAADDPSPFFPAKLADLLATGRPVLALTPRRSTCADLLGADHPLRVAPDDPQAIAGALAAAWRAWREGRPEAVRPPAAARAAVGEEAVGAALDAALQDAVRRGGAGRPARRGAG